MIKIAQSKWIWARSVPQLLKELWKLLSRTFLEPLFHGHGLNFRSFALLLVLLFIVQSYFNVDFHTAPTVCLLLWLAPFRTLGEMLKQVATLREQSVNFAPHTVDLILLAPECLPEMIPYAPKLLLNINKMGPLIGKTLEHKEYVVPLLKPLLENIDILIPLVDLLVPHFDKVVPHGEKLFPHLKVLIPHVESVAAHADALLPFLELEGWEDALPYLGPLARNIEQLAPHAHILQNQEVFDKLRPKIPVFVEHLDNLMPVIDQLAPHLPELLPYIDMIPLSLQKEYLKSKVACKALPMMVRQFRKLSGSSKRETLMLISPNSPVPAYPMPSSVEFSVKCFEKRVVNNAIVVFYKINIVAAATQQTRYFRYSTLRVFHKRLKKAYETKLGYFEFPQFPAKHRLAGSSEKMLIKRREELDEYLLRVTLLPEIMSLSVFKTFVQGFVVSGLIPVEFDVMLESL